MVLAFLRFRKRIIQGDRAQESSREIPCHRAAHLIIESIKLLTKQLGGRFLKAFWSPCGIEVTEALLLSKNTVCNFLPRVYAYVYVYVICSIYDLYIFVSFGPDFFFSQLFCFLPDCRCVHFLSSRNVMNCYTDVPCT